jgi:hypothetical protein
VVNVTKNTSTVQCPTHHGPLFGRTTAPGRLERPGKPAAGNGPHGGALSTIAPVAQPITHSMQGVKHAWHSQPFEPTATFGGGQIPTGYGIPCPVSPSPAASRVSSTGPHDSPTWAGELGPEVVLAHGVRVAIPLPLPTRPPSEWKRVFRTPTLGRQVRSRRRRADYDVWTLSSRNARFTTMPATRRESAPCCLPSNLPP